MDRNRKYWLLAIKNAAVFAVLCLLVLMLFGDSINEMTPWIALGYAALAFACNVPVFYLAFRYHWTEGSPLTFKWLLIPLVSFAIIIIPAVLYSSVAFGYSPSAFFFQEDGSLNTVQLLMSMKITLAGILIISVIQFMGASNEREIVVNSLPRNVSKDKTGQPKNKKVSLQGNAKNSSLELNIDQLLYVEADANYLNVVSLGTEVQSDTLRLTLKQFEEAVGNYPEIVRCHRAYLVNINNVSYLEGFSSKGELHFSDFQGTVPVSKTYLENISNLLKSRADT